MVMQVSDTTGDAQLSQSQHRALAALVQDGQNTTPGVDQRALIAQQTQHAVDKGLLGNVELVHDDAPQTPVVQPHDEHWYDGIGRVASSFSTGVVNEVFENPGGVILSGLMGAGIAVAVTFASPLIAAAVAAGAIGYTTYEITKNGGQWLHDIGVVASPEGHTVAEIASADEGVRGLGGGSVHLVAAGAGGYGALAIRSALSGPMTMATGEAMADGTSVVVRDVGPETTVSAVAGSEVSAGARAATAATRTSASETTATAKPATTGDGHGATTPPQEVQPSPGATASETRPVKTDKTDKPDDTGVPPAEYHMGSVTFPMRTKPLEAIPGELVPPAPDAAISVFSTDRWAALLKDNPPGTSGYRKLQLAKDWAALMEREMASGKKLEDVAEQALQAAGGKGITPLAFGQTVMLLCDNWLYGPWLERYLVETNQIAPIPRVIQDFN